MRLRLWFLPFVILAILAFSGCSEDDVTTPPTDHFEAIGVQLNSSGVEIARILRGVTNDTVFVPLNASTDGIFVRFFDEDEEIIDGPESEDQKLTWQIGNLALFEIWQHEGEEGGYEFHMRGLAEGLTTVEFFIAHAGHNDFRSGMIPVRVRDMTGLHGDPYGLIARDEESGDELARSFIVSAANSVTGAFTVGFGRTTDHIDISFVDVNSVVFLPGEDDHSLQIVVADESKAEIVNRDPNEPFAFAIRGKATGATTVTIRLLNEEAIAASFKPIPINVQ